MTDHTEDKQDEPSLKEKCMGSGKIAFPESAERATRCGNAVYGAVVYQLRAQTNAEQDAQGVDIARSPKRRILYENIIAEGSVADFNFKQFNQAISEIIQDESPPPTPYEAGDVKDKP